MRKTYLKKGDNVQIITGRDKGKKGRIISINKLNYTAIVEGINLVSKHTKPNQENPKGGVVEKEGSIHVSNVMVLQNGIVSRIGYKILEDGSKVRVFKKTNEEIQI